MYGSQAVAPSVKKGILLSDSSVLNSASGFFWMSTLMPTLASDSFTSAAIGSAVAAWPAVKAKVVEKPSGKPASARSFLASAGSVLFGIACGNEESGGVVDQVPS